ncbi:DUF4426 domain-containing protein [Rheinheimera sp. NSM]|uniref:DUF4426 domain-containing protein n=1 Tax=Rheinheimera sp. NSM TaxID=3457884 RepID=UPI004036AC9C
MMITWHNTMVWRSILFIVVLHLTVALTACGKVEQSVDSAKEPPNTGEPVGPEQPLGHIVEFDNFTLRANVSRATVLSDTMAQKYGITVHPDLAVLNLVILDNTSDRSQATVEAVVSARHENLLGHSKEIDMQSIETDGYISYIGTLDASSQRVFQLIISAQPQGSEQPLQMNFEVRLNW